MIIWIQGYRIYRDGFTFYHLVGQFSHYWQSIPLQGSGRRFHRQCLVAKPVAIFHQDILQSEFRQT